MGIDTGLNLIYNQNYPIPNVDQSSQQFRDNFSIIKTALERIHAATNGSESNFALNANQSSSGIITFDVNYKGNSLKLPTGDPSITASAGMIRYNSSSNVIQFYDGAGWRKIISEDAAGNVYLSNLVVTNRITTTNLTINSDPVSGTDAVRLSYLNTAFANMLVSGGYASQAQLLAEAQARAAEDVVLQAEIDAINRAITNSSATASSINAQISNLSNAIAAETNSRVLADNSQLDMINNTNEQVGILSNSMVEVYTLIDDERQTRADADTLLSQEIRNLSNSISGGDLAAEIAARISGDNALSNSIADLSNTVSSFGNYVPTSGGIMTGDLVVNNANVTINGGTLNTGDIITNGSITASGDISGLSDASLKDNVRTIENSLDKIDSLRGVLYTRNDLQGNPEQIGLIAQEVKETIPQVVHETENGLLSVSYGNLVSLLIEGIKDLRAEIEDIKKKLN